MINSVTGLGTGFLSGRALETVISALYRFAFRRSRKVFFLNRDDRDLFVRRKLVRSAVAQIIPGSGIDLQRFAVAPPKSAGPLTFLFIGRMLIDKGVAEFLQAAETVKGQLPATRFQILGPTDAHPKAVPTELLERSARLGFVELLGSTGDVRPYIARSDCIVLPSYREGLPRVLVEASAMGRPSIAADVPGCREVVDDKVTGYLCAERSAPELARAMVRFARLEPGERAAMGLAARRKAETEFGDDHIVDAYLRALEAISQRK